MYVHMSWLYIYIAFTVRKDLGYLHILKRCSRTPATSLPRGISIAMYIKGGGGHTCKENYGLLVLGRYVCYEL